MHASGCRIALVNQHHADQIDLTMSPLQFLMDKFPGDSSYDHEQARRCVRTCTRTCARTSARAEGAPPL